MYELNKEVVRLVSNLVHFKELLGVTLSRPHPARGLRRERGGGLSRRSRRRPAYLNEIADDIVGHLRTIIDLYINQSSFETNRILKILAVITSAGDNPRRPHGNPRDEPARQPYRLTYGSW